MKQGQTRWSKNVMDLMGCPHVCYKRAKRNSRVLWRREPNTVLNSESKVGEFEKLPLILLSSVCTSQEFLYHHICCGKKQKQKSHLNLFFRNQHYCRNLYVRQLLLKCTLCRLLRASREEMIGLREKRNNQVSFGKPVCFCVLKVRCSIAL